MIFIKTNINLLLVDPNSFHYFNAKWECVILWSANGNHLVDL